MDWQAIRLVRRYAKPAGMALLGMAMCLQSSGSLCQDAIPVTANNAWAKPLLIVPPAFPKDVASDARSVEVSIEGTVDVDGKLISPEFSSPDGTKTYVQAIKDVVKYWRFRPAIDVERCQLKESKQVVKVCFESKDGKPSISVSAPLGKTAGNDGRLGERKPTRQPTRQPKTVYPDAASRGGIEGYAELLLQVNDDGEVLSKQIISSVPNKLFGEAVVEAWRTARFPKLANGDGKPACSTVEVTFCLSGPEKKFPDAHCLRNPPKP
jgi:TonB family protein